MNYSYKTTTRFSPGSVGYACGSTRLAGHCVLLAVCQPNVHRPSLDASVATPETSKLMSHETVSASIAFVNHPHHSVVLLVKHFWVPYYLCRVELPCLRPLVSQGPELCVQGSADRGQQMCACEVVVIRADNTQGHTTDASADSYIA